eukprot:scaffold36161_cov63-Phaeocystis_antarctica.AAC.4
MSRSGKLCAKKESTAPSVTADCAGSGGHGSAATTRRPVSARSPAIRHTRYVATVGSASVTLPLAASVA